MAETLRFSKTYIPTLKETPSDAEVASHKLLLRAGMARKMASGLYVYLPLGLRVINKIAKIVREEMNRAGFQELLMPMVQPGDLWRETGRWEHYGKELLRFRDRNDRDYCLGPTHEEVVTDLLRGEIRSYKQLPVRVYQIQTKFRDEIRPRFGLMRGREFLMKDAYSFDRDEAGAKESYNLMYEAYMSVFNRLGLKYRVVEADTGSIGGNFSHEFMILAETGEDTVAACSSCGYGANVERAEVKADGKEPDVLHAKPEQVLTPNAHTVGEVCAFLKAEPQQLIKTLIYVADGKPVAALIRGDREVNEIKLKHILDAGNVELATDETVMKITGAPVGFAGPVKLDIPIYADNELRLATDYICGGNAADMHLKHVDLRRDANITEWVDLRVITAQDKCPVCGNGIFLAKGIEAGHIFMLGTKYSGPMKATFLDENGKEHPMVMGCYGIGISRLAAAAIEQGNDEKGIVFPPEIAPVDCIVLNLDPRNAEVSKTAEDICLALNSMDMDVLLDDRQERPGVKFNDADLLGIPMQIVVGAKGIEKGVIECKDRATGIKQDIHLHNINDELRSCIKSMEETGKNERAGR